MRCLCPGRCIVVSLGGNYVFGLAYILTNCSSVLCVLMVFGMAVNVVSVRMVVW